MTAFARAIEPESGRTALSQCKSLAVDSNPIGDIGILALTDAIVKGALPQVRQLMINVEDESASLK